ncbi:hypothetical protein Mnod_3240 [Methylobacterium nodulans ORS 2060]|uniref:Uncharacterized protein n=1 Tax=Methylobacterium nodulans (strain LMG 21967 / CNCM I-2342 / ORS 2060) TaxID=460265 RepID=B8IKX6_METNO|nr:hypothetical protein Mnod_3240 [Methylobacterium nodulans ORS 2060]
MSLRLQSPLPPVPKDTARVAQTAFPRGNPYLLLRARLGIIFANAGFADLYPKRGRPAYAFWRSAHFSCQGGFAFRQSSGLQTFQRLSTLASSGRLDAQCARDSTSL